MAKTRRRSRGAVYSDPVTRGPEPKGKVQIPLNLTPEQLARVMRIAVAHRATRNATLRHVIDRGLEAVEHELNLGR